MAFMWPKTYQSFLLQLAAFIATLALSITLCHCGEFDAATEATTGSSGIPPSTTELLELIPEVAQQNRKPRQTNGGTGTGDDAGTGSVTANQGEQGPLAAIPTDGNCDFGRGENGVGLCSWRNPNNSRHEWIASRGANFNWRGGPNLDASGSDEGGYTFFETSDAPASGRLTPSAILESVTFRPTQPSGQCLSFRFQRFGLSPNELEVYLHPVEEEEKLFGFDPNYRNRDIRLWRDDEDTMGKWKAADILYSFPEEYKILFEATPKTDERRFYRGYFALDNIQFLNSGDCRGHCNFDGSFCSWANAGGDNFDWSLGRGSDNDQTGPKRDRTSTAYGGKNGGYAYIDSSYPRRPGDIAILESADFVKTAENEPHCMTFYTHMLGSGIGALNVYIQPAGQEKRLIWKAEGPEGNTWYKAQAPIASSEGFKILIEATVGKNSLGQIAIDDISFTKNSCPTYPQIAAPTGGDCSFESDTCAWRDYGRSAKMRWRRLKAREGKAPPEDHTTGTREGFYMTLPLEGLITPGEMAWLVLRDSERIISKNGASCLTFWYYMRESFIDPRDGPSLGSLQVLLKKFGDSNSPDEVKTIWKLTNHQGQDWTYAQVPIQQASKLDESQLIIEGMWGSSRPDAGFIAIDDVIFYDSKCEVMPSKARVNPGDCSFDRDLCNYRRTEDNDRSGNWQLAIAGERLLRNMNDHTYSNPAGGYAYFDIYDTNQRKIRLVSPIIEPPVDEDDRACLAFWFHPLGSGDSTTLQLLQRVGDSNEVLDNEENIAPIWKIQTHQLDRSKDDWMFAQVEIENARAFRLIFEGIATKGGFALDDIRIYTNQEERGCDTRPATAKGEETRGRQQSSAASVTVNDS